jgi:hypothetical protein
LRDADIFIDTAACAAVLGNRAFTGHTLRCKPRSSASDGRKDTFASLALLLSNVTIPTTHTYSKLRIVEEKPAPVVQPEDDSVTNVKQAFDLVVKFGPGTIRELTNRATSAGVATPSHLSQNLNSLKRQERLNRWQRGSEWVYYLTDRETDGLAEIKTNRDQAIDLILRFGEGLTAREIKARLAAEGEQLSFDLKSTLLTLAKPSVRKLTTKKTVTGENRYYLPETQESQRHAS